MKWLILILFLVQPLHALSIAASPAVVTLDRSHQGQMQLINPTNETISFELITEVEVFPLKGFLLPHSAQGIKIRSDENSHLKILTIQDSTVIASLQVEIRSFTVPKKEGIVVLLAIVGAGLLIFALIAFF